MTKSIHTPIREYEKDLNRFFANLRTDPSYRLDDARLALVFLAIRNLLEDNELLYKFGVTNFYINWIVHNRLDKRNTVEDFIRQIGNSLKNHFSGKKNACDAVSEVVGLHLLRAELGKVFELFGIDPLIIGDRWRDVCGQILRLVLFKPISAKSLVTVGPTEVEGIDYEGFPVFWLSAVPGEQTLFNVAIVPRDRELDRKTILTDPKIVTFQGGVFFVL